MFWAGICKISEYFIWKFSFFVCKISIYLNRRVSVMVSFQPSFCPVSPRDFPCMNKWTGTQHCMCAQPRLKSICASAQSDQSLRCLFYPWPPTECSVKSLIGLWACSCKENAVPQIKLFLSQYLSLSACVEATERRPVHRYTTGLVLWDYWAHTYTISLLYVQLE